MADRELERPHCRQHLTAEAATVGMETECPGCHNRPPTLPS